MHQLEKKQEMRTLVAEGIDPKTYRDNQRINAQIAQASTLRAVAEEWFEVKSHKVSANYADDIWRSLELHVFQIWVIFRSMNSPVLS